jgi:hypothetical protein
MRSPRAGVNPTIPLDKPDERLGVGFVFQRVPQTPLFILAGIGSAASRRTVRGILFQSSKRAQGGPTAPLLPFPKCPHTREEKIGN